MVDLGPEYVRAPNGLILPEWAAQQRYVKRTPIAVDFFSGAGGFSLGVIQAGFHVVAAVENDPTCVMTYMANLARYGECEMVFIDDSDRERMEKAIKGEMKRSSRKGELERMPVAGSGWISHQPPSTPSVKRMFIGDVRKLTGEAMLRVLGLKRGDIDLVLGGPPCQGFSVSGKRNVMDPRNSLVFEYARMIVELQPKTMCMENVPGIMTMVTADGLPVVETFCRILEDGGFGTVDGIRKMLAQQTGRTALLRTGDPPTKRGRAKREAIEARKAAKAAPGDQLGLFDV